MGRFYARRPGDESSGVHDHGRPRADRSKSRRSSSLRTRMQPFETAPPISSGRFVPWIAIGPPCVQPVSTFGECRDADRAGPEGAGGVAECEALVDVVAARRRRRLGRADRRPRGEHPAAAVEEGHAPQREIDLDARRDGREGDVARPTPSPSRRSAAVAAGRGTSRSGTARRPAPPARRTPSARRLRSRRRIQPSGPPPERDRPSRARDDHRVGLRLRAERPDCAVRAFVPFGNNLPLCDNFFGRGASERVGAPESPPQPARARTASSTTIRRIPLTVAACDNGCELAESPAICSPFRYLLCPIKRLP